MNISLIERAFHIAVTAHDGQLRKEGDIPYIVHPFAVALYLARRGFPDTVIAAALVHDVLEDTEYPEEQLREELGLEVMDIVYAVTNDDTKSWDEKKLRYIETVRMGPDGAKAVATADKIHNAESLIHAYKKEGNTVWAHFNQGREKKLWFEEEMLRMLKETWDDPMVSEYEALVEQLKGLE